MDSNMESMLDMYLFETNTLMEQLDEILLNAERVGSFSQEDVNEIFRIMHTVKGSSAMMQFNSIMTIAHRIEDLFFIIRERGTLGDYGSELFEVMFSSGDFLKAEVEKVQNNEPLTINIDSFEEKINLFIKKLKGEVVKGQASQEKKEVKSQGEYAYAIKIFFEEGVGMENLRAFMLINSIKDVCSNYKYYPAEIEDDSGTSNYIIDNGFLISFESEDEIDSALTVLKSALNIKSYEIIEGQAMPAVGEEFDEQVASEDEAPKAIQIEEAKVQQLPQEGEGQKAAQQGQSTRNQSMQSLISVNLSKLDKLMDIVGEIVITESMVTSSPDIQGMKLDNFIKSARQLRKLTDELQSIVMSVRMVPVSGVFQKMNRIVRDMSHKLKKEAVLKIIGEDTEVDKTIVDSISDPIMHLVRNAMDHGLEKTAEERIALGKPAGGTITLRAEHTGSVVLITISDDGKGIDCDTVLQKAKERGILTKPESEYTQREIQMLIMAAGFSTNDNVTEFSGRGVGMDVVKKNVEKVGGTVSISSELGKGTTITFKIPLTLAIVAGMEVSVGASIFTVPIMNIIQSFEVKKDEIVYDTDMNEMIYKMGEYYPIIRLHEFYNIQGAKTEIDEGMLIRVESGECGYCLFVDKLLGEQQVVVKPLPAYVNGFNIKNSGMAGCTILGNGDISLILDIQNLFEASIG